MLAALLSQQLAHRDLAPRIHVRNAPKADKPEPTRMTLSRHSNSTDPLCDALCRRFRSQACDVQSKQGVAAAIEQWPSSSICANHFRVLRLALRSALLALYPASILLW